jgi:hypothetical protein
VGFVRKKKTFKLHFEGDEWDGLEVRVKSVPVGRYLELASMVDTLQAVQGKSSLSAEDLDTVSVAFRAIAEVILEWNLEEETADGGVAAVPATYDGLMSQDLDLVMAVMAAWSDAMTGASGPLPQPSPSGETAQEVSLPMVALSGSPTS